MVVQMLTALAVSVPALVMRLVLVLLMAPGASRSLQWGHSAPVVGLVLMRPAAHSASCISYPADIDTRFLQAISRLLLP